MAWHDEVEAWYRYNEEDGFWSKESPVSIEAITKAEMDSNPKTMGRYSYSNLVNVIKFMRANLLVKQWVEAPGYLCLHDGALCIATGNLEPHRPGFRFLNQIPYPWSDRSKGCEPIRNWLLEITQGDEDTVRVLRAFLKAIVTNRPDLQRYLELLGPGGSGKSTLLRLATDLIGSHSVASTSLARMEGNRFELAKFVGKKLIIVTDSERYGGEVSVLKSITGQDTLPIERKNQQQERDSRINALVAMASNEPIQSSDYTSGLERRRVSILLTYQCPEEKRRDLESEFKPYLAGLLEWVLEMPDEEMVKLVRETKKYAPGLARQKAENLVETNPIAQWANECLVYSPNRRTQVGIKRRSKDPDSPHVYDCTSVWLYASYCEYTEGVGNKTISQKRFTPMVIDLLKTQLKLEGIFSERDRDGRHIWGIEIRKTHHRDDLLITKTQKEAGGATIAPEVAKAVGFVTGGDGSVTAETLGSAGCDGCVGFNETQSENLSQVEKNNFQNATLGESNLLPPYPSPPGTIEHQQGFEPSHPPVTTRHDPSQSEQNDIKGIVEMLVGFGREGILDEASLTDLTSHLSPQGKQEVWRQLPEDVRQILKAFHPQENSVSPSKPSSVVPSREIKFDPTNWNGFPWERESGWQPGEDRERTRQKKSEQLRDALLGVRTQDDFDDILNKWGGACIRWVDGNLLTPEEVASRNCRIQASRESEQQSLL